MPEVKAADRATTSTASSATVRDTAAVAAAAAQVAADGQRATTTRTQWHQSVSFIRKSFLINVKLIACQSHRSVPSDGPVLVLAAYTRVCKVQR